MTEFTIPAHRLRTALTTALQFTDQDGEWSHPVLCCVHITPAADQVLVLASDRYAACKELIKAVGDPFPLTVPPEVARRVVDAINDDETRSGMPPTGMATFVRASGDPEDEVTIRLVGGTDSEFTFPYADTSSGMVGPVTAVFEKAGERTADLAGAHFNPDRLATAVAAISSRPGGEPVRVLAGTAGEPLVVARGDDFKAAIMPIRVDL